MQRRNRFADIASAIALVLSPGLIIPALSMAEILFQDDFEDAAFSEANWEPADTFEIVDDPLGSDSMVLYRGEWTDQATLPKMNDLEEYNVEFDCKLLTDGGWSELSTHFKDKEFYALATSTGESGIWTYTAGQWSGNLAPFAFVPEEKWYRLQIAMTASDMVIKIKESSDDTAFEDIDPIVEFLNDGTFQEGRFGVDCATYIDNLVIYAGEFNAIVEIHGKAATTWGSLKAQ